MFGLIRLTFSNNVKFWVPVVAQFMFGVVALMIGLSLLFNLNYYENRLKKLAPLEAVKLTGDDKDSAVIEDKEDDFLKGDNIVSGPGKASGSATGDVGDYDGDDAKEVPEEPVKTIDYQGMFRKLLDEGVLNTIGSFRTAFYSTYYEEDFYIKIPTSNHFVLPEETLKNIDNINYYEESLISIFITNNELLKMVSFDLSSGSEDRLLNYKSGDVIPALVSAPLGKENAVGMKRNVYIDNVEYVVEVVGVMKPDMPYFRDSTNAIGFTEYKNIVVIPSAAVKGELGSIDYCCHTFALLNKDMPYKDAKSGIESVYEDYGLKVEISSFQEELDWHREISRNIYIVVFIFAGVILVLTIFGFIGVVVASIARRQMEFGIYYVNGITTFNMGKLIIGEMFLVILWSFVIGVGGVIALNYTVLADEKINITIASLLATFLIMVAVLLLSIIAPINNLRRTEPFELLRK